jgi:hypothetical protein
MYACLFERKCQYHYYLFRCIRETTIWLILNAATLAFTQWKRETVRLDWHILLINRSTVDYLFFITRRKSRWTQVCVQSDFLTSANEWAYVSMYIRWLSLVQIFSLSLYVSPVCSIKWTIYIDTGVLMH